MTKTRKFWTQAEYVEVFKVYKELMLNNQLEPTAILSWQKAQRIALNRGSISSLRSINVSSVASAITSKFRAWSSSNVVLVGKKHKQTSELLKPIPAPPAVARSEQTTPPQAVIPQAVAKPANLDTLFESLIERAVMKREAVIIERFQLALDEHQALIDSKITALCDRLIGYWEGPTTTEAELPPAPAPAASQQAIDKKTVEKPPKGPSFSFKNLKPFKPKVLLFMDKGDYGLVRQRCPNADIIARSTDHHREATSLKPESVDFVISSKFISHAVADRLKSTYKEKYHFVHGGAAAVAEAINSLIKQL